MFSRMLSFLYENRKGAQMLAICYCHRVKFVLFWLDLVWVCFALFQNITLRKGEQIK